MNDETCPNCMSDNIQHNSFSCQNCSLYGPTKETKEDAYNAWKNLPRHSVWQNDPPKEKRMVGK